MEWWHILIIIIFAETVLNAIGTCVYMNLYDKWYIFVPMPSDFKDETEMNWFGSIVCYMLLFILFPILNIGKLIYWLFHI